jgi:hypothetical protein
MRAFTFVFDGYWNKAGNIESADLSPWLYTSGFCRVVLCACGPTFNAILIVSRQKVHAGCGQAVYAMGVFVCMK